MIFPSLWIKQKIIDFNFWFLISWFHLKIICILVFGKRKLRVYTEMKCILKFDLQSFTAMSMFLKNLKDRFTTFQIPCSNL